MSRVTLSFHPDGTAHVIVGWDPPLGGCFWQEYGSKAEVAAAQTLMEQYDEFTPKEIGEDEVARTETLAETGIKRSGGMLPAIPIGELHEAVPEDLRPLITGGVLNLLARHSRVDDGSRRYVVTYDYEYDATMSERPDMRNLADDFERN